ncbi:2-(1,2-epoxy-1,2-dihydrophenyl)acetyl-CoA isomerase [Mycolicibacterium iranicum]|uniref:2-(1,2-epoxy-1,2-dihydrophenyl)acetyl-CoA isomerase n=1 Tax=Mycolicibacterium iranicum TaxID=912594 RepID=A0A839QAC4_MYCIR|nr:nuclear transport factor 2 family protein [Mycolicibacterium iranicum]MBB2991156.1 2-(1,2-epoxy-1,2-dihydrophenyl)acetyl-CoA isomerase [Mycolicibacterium iranicum]
MHTVRDVVQRFYRALSESDVDALSALLTDDFEGTVSAGMPHGVGGEHHGRVAMITGVWGRIAAAYDVDVVPGEYLGADADGGRMVVLGNYRGRARDAPERVDAAFAHVITVENGQITALQQITDTVRWHIPA